MWKEDKKEEDLRKRKKVMKMRILPLRSLRILITL
jgi:hypothetical protein